MKAVIVYFPGKGFSLKTETKCYWCRGEFWETAEPIFEKFPELEFHAAALTLQEYEQPRDLDRKIRKIFMTWPKKEKVAEDVPGTGTESFDLQLHKDWSNPFKPYGENEKIYEDRPLIMKFVSREYWMEFFGIK